MPLNAVATGPVKQRVKKPVWSAKAACPDQRFSDFIRHQRHLEGSAGFTPRFLIQWILVGVVPKMCISYRVSHEAGVSGRAWDCVSPDGSGSPGLEMSLVWFAQHVLLLLGFCPEARACRQPEAYC